jgi:hypothetical protein
MAISSKINIDVDSAAFAAFQDKFDKYKASLEKTDRAQKTLTIEDHTGGLEKSPRKNGQLAHAPYRIIDEGHRGDVVVQLEQDRPFNIGGEERFISNGAVKYDQQGGKGERPCQRTSDCAAVGEFNHLHCGRRHAATPALTPVRHSTCKSSATSSLWRCVSVLAKTDFN